MCWLKGVKVITLVSVVMTVAHLQVLSAGERYKFAIIAATGQPIGDELLAGIENNVSMNGNGKVAFVGTVGNRYYVCIGDGVDRFFTITPNFSLQSNRRFDAAVQINDNDQVVATDRVVTTPILTFVRIWDGRALDSDRLIARGGPGYPYDTILSRPSINYSGDVVFSAARGSSTLLVTPAASGFNELTLNAPNVLLRPLISDSGRVSVRAGQTSNLPILLFEPDLTRPQAIASSTYFLETGRSPGISHDEVVAAFYGNLTPDGAAQLNVEQAALRYPDGSQIELSPLTAGKGIFISVQTIVGRIIQRIASEGGAISRFEPDSRVGAAAMESVYSAATIAYVAYDSAGRQGLYTSRVNMKGVGLVSPLPPAYFRISSPVIVTQQGKQIEGLSGTVQSVVIYDPVSEHRAGEVAFWVGMDDGKQAVVRASPNSGVDLSDVPTDWSQVVIRHNPWFVIADAWGGLSEKPAHSILFGAPPDLAKAAYGEVNFKDSARPEYPFDQTGYYQMQRAIHSVGDQIDSLSFMAIAVEAVWQLIDMVDDNDGSDCLSSQQSCHVRDQSQQAKAWRTDRVCEAIQTVQLAGLIPVIYTNKSHWTQITETDIFGGLPLWNTTGDLNPSLRVPDFRQEANRFGGWTVQTGKQYCLDNPVCKQGDLDVDLNVFDPSLFTQVRVSERGTALDVTDKVIITQGEVTMDPRSGRWKQTVALRLQSGADTVNGPVSLVLDNLGAGTGLFNGNGVTTRVDPLGSPYIHVFLGCDNRLMIAGAVSVTMEFESSSGVVTYAPRILAGFGDR